MKTQFGFIQGRVSKTPSKKILQYFPTNNWRKEFSIASKLKFNFIEYFGERKKIYIILYGLKRFDRN